MNITQYNEMKQTGNAQILNINGTPALRRKKYSPDTGEYIGDEEIGIDIKALEKTIVNLQAQIESITAIIKDSKACGEDK